MAIEKFKFVSPGVQVNEIDQSVVTSQPPAIGPVVIGRTAKGPLMQPVQVSSVSELQKVFGSPSNGFVGAADVWRSGVPTAPTFATYAAQAFLRNSAPVTVIRLGGTTKLNATDTGEAGWTASEAYGLFGISGSSAKLAAVIYTETSSSLSVSSSSLVETGTVGNNIKNVQLYLSGSSAFSTLPKVSFDPADQNFIRNVFLTNPTKVSGSGFFLGETYENSLGEHTASVYLAKLNGTLKFDELEYGPLEAESAKILFDNGESYTELFTLVGLNNGASLSRETKISIENVRESKNPNVTKYATFDVVVRQLFETATSTALERFNGVNLDINSQDYIARVIGDSYRRWDAAESRYVEEGNYPNRSAYVRVEMSTDDVPPTAIPNAFMKALMPTDFGSNITSSFTASHPDISLFTDSVSKSAAKSKRFGLMADAQDNADLVDILRFKPDWDSGVAENTGSVFTTKQIHLSGNTVQYNSSSARTGSLLTTGGILGFDVPIYGGFDGVDIKQAEPLVNNALLTATSVDETTSNAYRSVKQALDLVANPENLDMSILCVPNLKAQELTDYMVELCRLRGDALALIDLDGDYLFPFEATTDTVKGDKPANADDAISNLVDRKLDNSYGAAYFPAVFVSTENIFMPASVAALGALGGTEGRSALWFAPAGFNRGGLTTATSGLAVSRTALTLTATDRDNLYNVNINPIATFPSEGVVIFGQKTLQVTPSALDRVNVRRLMNFIKKQISRAATRVLFEPNVERTWNNFKGVVDPFLLAIKNSYGLDDAQVILDESTTTADLIDRNIMYCKIFVKPTRAIEYIAIDFVVTNSGASFTE